MGGSFVPLYRRLSRKSAATAVVGLAILNVVFAAALAGVVATQLDYQSGSPGCLLNSKGQVCVFTYITAGAIMLFSLLTLLPAVFFYRRGAPLHIVYLQLGVFSFFWQLVMAITITIRGGQASDAGLPKESSREAAYAFAWLGVSLTFVSCLVVIADVLRERAVAKEENRLLRKQSTLDIGSVAVVHRGVGVV